MPDHHLIDTQEALGDLLDELAEVDVYALDTEFHRERTYYPQLALVQVAWGDRVALIDPLAVDVRGLGRLFERPQTVVIHACGQDIEVLHHSCGAVPPVVFDTQVAAGFVGMSTPSLSSLLHRKLGVDITKADRLTDWLERPLGERQRRYAASDVAHLLELHSVLVDELVERRRLTWAEDECELVRQRSIVVRDPDDAWLRIKEARQLRGRAAAVARSVAAWREREAAQIDQPARYVMSDLAVVSIAQQVPRSDEELGRIRGIDGRHRRKASAKKILEAVAAGLNAGPAAPTRPKREALDRKLRPAVGLASAWLAQLARDLDLDATLLATRADIEALLRGDQGARLGVGWRQQIVGEPLRELIDGRAALSFDGSGGLVLEERSGRALVARDHHEDVDQ